MLRDESELVDELFTIIRTLYTDPPPTTALPAPSSLSHARESLAAHLPDTGLGLCAAVKHLTDDIAPALGRSGRSPNYYGFVIGGSTPAASLADNLVTAVDENVHSYLPSETIAVEVEDRALSLLCEPLDLHASQWPHRIFTTGATASHMLGLACAREHVIVEATALRSGDAISVGQMGVHEAMRRAGLDRIQILTTAPHSSLFKAASIVGLGRDCVQAVGQRDAPHRFDMEHLKRLLEKPTTASIVVVSASEVNAGLFATSGLPEMQEIRRLCDCYGAWTHVDGGECSQVQRNCLCSSAVVDMFSLRNDGPHFEKPIPPTHHQLLSRPRAGRLHNGGLSQAPERSMHCGCSTSPYLTV